MTITPMTKTQPGNRDWKIVNAESFHKLEDLLEYCEIDPVKAGAVTHPDFALRVTKYFASLIEKGNPRDPLLLQVLPKQKEFQVVSGYQRDAVGDGLSMPVRGLIHKYHGRVLLTMTGACAIHCRYCFRRHFPYRESRVDDDISGPVVKYLAENTSIREVILSGGDPLMLSDQKLGKLIQALNKLPHIRLLRIHSRLLSVLPERVNEGLIETLLQFDGQVVMVTHINHANELSAHNQAAFQRMFEQGFSLFNQSVLLRGVNDDAQALMDLSYKLFESHITPYYLHRLDKVQGAAHFDLSAEESCEIYKVLLASLPGYLLPAMVDEVAGQLSKTPVNCG